MKTLSFGFFFICIAFSIHFVVWRIRLPKRQTKTLLQIFFVTLAGGLLALRSTPYFFASCGFPPPESLPEYLHITLFFTSFTLAYMITYSAIEADSPTLVMINRIEQAGSEGIGVDHFKKEMSNDILITPRVNDLLLDKMAVFHEGRYRLTPKGILMTRIFMGYRKLLNAAKGG